MGSPTDIMEFTVTDKDGNITQSTNKSYLRKQENERIEKIAKGTKEFKKKEKEEAQKILDKAGIKLKKNGILKTRKSDKGNRSKVETKKEEKGVGING